MQGLLRLSRVIDAVLAVFAKIGAWMGLALVLVVTYDVATRYLGVPKLFGITSTEIQESEYWLHSGLIMFLVGYAYTRQSHVRIDLLRENFSEKTKYWLEAVGILITLIPYSILGVYLSYPYAVSSFLSGEISKSQTGLTNLWILKSGLVIMFVLMGLAGLSQFIKSVAGIRGQLPPELRHSAIGGGH